MMEQQSNTAKLTKAVALEMATRYIKTKYGLFLLGAAAVVLAIIGALVAFVLFFASTGGQESSQGWLGGTISPLGEKEIPAEFIPIYKAAAEKYGVPWNLLAAHHKVETGFSSHPTMTSSVGAIGHFQFMRCTWLGWNYSGCKGGLGNANIPDRVLTNPISIKQFGGFGVDANGDKKADPWDLEDATYTAAAYLAANGAASGNLRQAVFAYNHDQEYVAKVLAYADQYVTGYIAVNVSAQVIEGTSWPVPSTMTITSTFGGRIHPITGVYEGHGGIDIAGGQVNGKPVASFAEGVVTYSGWRGGYGNCVVVDHGRGISTLYGHLLNPGIKSGSKVKAGQTIGNVGSTGRSTGPHLHFEVRVNNTPVDPLKYLTKFQYKMI